MFEIPFELAHTAFAHPFVTVFSPRPNNRSHYRQDGYRLTVRYVPNLPQRLHSPFAPGVKMYRAQCSVRHGRCGCSEDPVVMSARTSPPPPRSGTQEMASQIINALQQAGRGIEPISAAAKTSKSQRKKQKAELVLVLHRPVGPLRPLNSWTLAGEFIPPSTPASCDELALGSEHT